MNKQQPVALRSLVLAGLLAGWSFQDGLVSALQGPISGYFNGADFSWLFGILVAGGLYLLIGGRGPVAKAK